ncbi:MAG: hypothetical protein HYZ01_11905 [Ignavibacteriales bacterium]|nr:hypothetical protein [Ignavibacteriales bacterium]
MIGRFFSQGALLIAALLVCSVSLAQRRGGAPDQDSMRRPGAERVEQFKKLRLMEVLQLDEEASIRFFARYNKHEAAMREIRQKQLEFIQQIQSLRRSQAPDVDYQRVLRELRALEQRLSETKLKYMDELTDILTQKQVAEYIVFEIRFQQNLREILRDMQQERGGVRD